MVGQENLKVSITNFETGTKTYFQPNIMIKKARTANNVWQKLNNK